MNTNTGVQYDNPALNLLDVFEHGEKAVAEKEAMGLRTLDMGRAVEAVPMLGEMKTLSDEDVERWLSYWMEVKLLSGDTAV